MDLTYDLYENLKCDICGSTYYVVEGIPVFSKPPFDRREYFVEVQRYNRIALRPPETYGGFDASYPEERADFLSKWVIKEDRYLNIGQGFGLLEEKLPEVDKYCLDQSFEFLKLCRRRRIPNIKYVCGYAEKMPFKDGYFNTVVSDSVFQTVVDQKEFLIENARVLKSGGKLLLTITHRWNYPRKPQAFPVDRPTLLKSFLGELGIKSEIEYVKFPDMERVSNEDLNADVYSDMLFLIGEKE